MYMSKVQTPAAEHKHARIELVGATCTSCAIGIEHMGSRLEGVYDIWVDKQESCIKIEYDGNIMQLEKICDFIHRIGYQANIVQSE